MFLLEYDYALQVSAALGAGLSSGSKLLAFIANSAGQAARNGTVLSGLALSSRWVSEAPGHTYAFNGWDDSFALALAGGHPQRKPRLAERLSPN